MRSPWLSLANIDIFPQSQPSTDYQYDPLPEGNYTRYLVLRPGKGQDPLVCDLHIAALTELFDCEAISYVWGSNNKVAEISCNERTIRITANLQDALRQVRSADSAKKLWADSICINQKDEKEQGHQVALMGQIYRQADKTLICLGQDNGQGKDIASLLDHVNTMIESQLAEFGSRDELPLLDNNDPLAQDQRWDFLTNMRFHPWFSRVWVVQEAAVAKDARILYGDTEFPWLYLLKVSNWLFAKARVLWRKQQMWLNSSYDQAFWTTKAESPLTKFVELLVRARVLRCSDPRDRVYAFLGSRNAQVSPNDDLIIVPVYNIKDHRKMYQEFAEQVLRHTDDLSLLSAVEHTSATLKLKIPSWVPQWDYAVVDDNFGLHGRQFNASKAMSRTGPSFVSNGTLRVHGIIVDTICYRSKVLPFFMPWGTIPEGFVNSFKALPGQHQEILQAIWRLFPENVQKFISKFLTFFLARNRDELIEIWKHLSDPSVKSAYDYGERLLAFSRTLHIGALNDNHSEFTANEASFALDLCKKSARWTRMNPSALEVQANDGDITTFMTDAADWCPNRRFILTGEGYYGLAPKVVKEGDVCCIIRGLRVPVILRKTGKEHHYKFIGEAFILGMMQGEAIENIGDWESKEQEFVLC